MNKTLCLIAFLIVSIYVDAQLTNVNDITIRNSLTLKDSTVTVIGQDTLTSPSMVRKLISEGSGYTGSNGITKVGSDFQLGGTLTKNTLLNGNSYNYSIGGISSNVNNFSVYSSGTSLINSNIFKITIPSYEWNFSGKTITGSDSDYLIYNTRLVDYVGEQQKSAPFIFLYENQGVTSDVRPGTGFYSANSSTPSLITEFYIDDFDQNGVDKHNFIQLADSGSYFYLQEKGVTSSYYMYQIAGFIDNAGWTTYDVEYKFSVGTISETDNIELVLEPNNNRGSGGGSMDSLYIKGQNQWIINEDTIYYVDTSNYSLFSDIANYAYKSDSNHISTSADTVKIKAYSPNSYHKMYNAYNNDDILKITAASTTPYTWAELSNENSADAYSVFKNSNGHYIGIFESYIMGDATDIYLQSGGNSFSQNETSTNITSANLTLTSPNFILSSTDPFSFSHGIIKDIDSANIDKVVSSKINVDSIISNFMDILKIYVDSAIISEIDAVFAKIDTIEIGDNDTIIGGIDAVGALMAEEFDSLDIKKIKADTLEGNVFINGDVTLNGIMFDEKYWASAFLNLDSTIVTNINSTTYTFLGAGSNNKFTNIPGHGFEFDGDTLYFDQDVNDARDSVGFFISYGCESATASVNRTIYNAIFTKHIGGQYVEYVPVTKKNRKTTAGVYYTAPIAPPMPIWLRDGDKIQIRAKCASSTATLSTQGFGITIAEL